MVGPGLRLDMSRVETAQLLVSPIENTSGPQHSRPAPLLPPIELALADA